MKPYELLNIFVKLDLQDKCDGKSGFSLNDWIFPKERNDEGNPNWTWAYIGPGKCLWEFKGCPKSNYRYKMSEYFKFRTGYFSLGNWEQITWGKILKWPFYYLYHEYIAHFIWRTLTKIKIKSKI